jgi:hypothetical protein
MANSRNQTRRARSLFTVARTISFCAILPISCKKDDKPAKPDEARAKVRVGVAINNQCGDAGFALVAPDGTRKAVFDRISAGSRAVDPSLYSLDAGVAYKAILYPGGDHSMGKTIGTYTPLSAHNAKRTAKPVFNASASRRKMPSP